jgi:signal transduction histidine kinase
MKRLISLVNRIMDYEKLERKKFDLTMTDFDAVSLVISLVETHKKRLKENKQRIKVV